MSVTRSINLASRLHNGQSTKKEKTELEGCAHSRNVGSSARGNPRQRDVSCAPKKGIMKGYAGIYVLYDGEIPHYVGLARNLLGRIRQHMKDSHANKWDGFRVFRIQRVRVLKDIETLIQNVVDFPGNKQKGKVPRDADFNRILKDELAVHRRAIKEMEKALRKR
jgi:hypothetical protein